MAAEEELNVGEHHPLLVISWLIGQLLVCCPFTEANHRTTFALMRHLLLKSGYGFVSDRPVEVVFERDVRRFHEVLQGVQRTLGTDGSGMMEWQGYFLSSLAAMARASDDAVKLSELVKELPPLSDELVKLIRVQGKVTVRDAQASTGANRNTVKAHLRRLVEDGLLMRKGVGKGSWYQMPVS